MEQEHRDKNLCHHLSNNGELSNNYVHPIISFLSGRWTERSIAPMSISMLPMQRTMSLTLSTSLYMIVSSSAEAPLSCG